MKNEPKRKGMMSKYNLFTNPEIVRESMDGASKSAKVVLGLDLGTTTGFTYALVGPGSVVGPSLIKPEYMGQWDLSAGPYDSGALRFLRMRYFLAAVAPAAVFVENVRYSPPGAIRMNPDAAIARVSTAAEFLGALKATVATWCEEYDIPCGSFGIGSIKKRATGRGNADKLAIIAAANSTFGCALEPEGFETTGVDNIADSAFVCLMGLEQYALGFREGGPGDA
jgi:hypothetical protein